MSYRLRNIVIAIVLAVMAALLTTIYVTSYKKHVDSQQQNTQVYVAARDIPAGTLGSQIVAGHMLTTVHVARKALVPGLVTNPAQISGLIVTQPVFRGEQITARRFGPVTEQGIRTQLRGTYRAFQLNGDSNQILAGTVHSGDHVDVVGVLTLHGNTAADLTFARVVIRDVQVLKTSAVAGTAAITSPNSGGGSLILRVTDNQAQKLALVYKKGDYWALELRPTLNDADSPSSVETGWTLLTDGLGAGKIAKATGGPN